MEDTDFHKITMVEREHLISIISHVLTRAEEVVFAYIYTVLLQQKIYLETLIYVYISVMLKILSPTLGVYKK